jgi:hypothetical protein
MATRYQIISTKDKAAGSDVDTGTDDTKFVTVKALNDSHNSPLVAPGTNGNTLISNGTDWVSTTTVLNNNVFRNTIASIADNGTDTATPLTTLSGMMIVIYNGSSGFRRTGVFIFEAYGLGATWVMSDVASVFSAASGTASKVNIYYDGASGVGIENKTGETISNISIIVLGRQT